MNDLITALRLAGVKRLPMSGMGQKADVCDRPNVSPLVPIAERPVWAPDFRLVPIADVRDRSGCGTRPDVGLVLSSRFNVNAALRSLPPIAHEDDPHTYKPAWGADDGRVTGRRWRSCDLWRLDGIADFAEATRLMLSRKAR